MWWVHIDPCNFSSCPGQTWWLRFDHKTLTSKLFTQARLQEGAPVSCFQVRWWGGYLTISRDLWISQLVPSLTSICLERLYQGLLFLDKKQPPILPKNKSPSTLITFQGGGGVLFKCMCSQCPLYPPKKNIKYSQTTYQQHRQQSSLEKQRQRETVVSL